MIKLRPAGQDDVPALVDLAELARAEYVSYEPDFWRPAATARLMHTPYLAFLVDAPDVRVWIAEQHGRVEGFLTLRDSPRPPGLGGCGRLWLVDDYAVRERAEWPDVGGALLERAVRDLGRAEPVLLLVVCGHADRAKAATLAEAELSPGCAFRLLRLDDAGGGSSAVRPAAPADAEGFAALARTSAARQHGMQLLWRQPPDPGGYRELIADPDCLALTLERDGRIEGYALGRAGLPAPPVYDPGGSTCLVDELAVAGTGPDQDYAALLAAAERVAADGGDRQLLVACPAREPSKRRALDSRGYRWPVDWYAREIAARPA